MSKYIDRAALFNSLSGAKTVEEIFAAIQAVPAEDVQEVRHGEWENINRNKYNDDEATCSLCGRTFSSSYSDPCWWSYCPNCGAKMDGEQDG